MGQRAALEASDEDVSHEERERFRQHWYAQLERQDLLSTLIESERTILEAPIYSVRSEMLDELEASLMALPILLWTLGRIAVLPEIVRLIGEHGELADEYGFLAGEADTTAPIHRVNQAELRPTQEIMSALAAVLSLRAEREADVLLKEIDVYRNDEHGDSRLRREVGEMSAAVLLWVLENEMRWGDDVTMRVEGIVSGSDA